LALYNKGRRLFKGEFPIGGFQSRFLNPKAKPSKQDPLLNSLQLVTARYKPFVTD